MKLFKALIICTITFYLAGCNTTEQEKKKQIQEPFIASWESLSNHNEAPEWFKEAKFGIYFHWGVYSVPAYGNEWYPRYMHIEGHDIYEHHLKTYGHPSEFGYHDFVPMFKAEKFNAEEWAELFKKAGARFAGLVAEHHDGFSMWDSEITPWNVMDKGPKRDITGELKQAISSRGMRFITTFHHAKHLQRNTEINGKAEQSHYPLIEGMPPASKDPELAMLYGNIPREEWYEKIWLGKLKEVIDKYNPDIMWFDYLLDSIPETYRKEYCAYYLNQAQKWNRDVVIVRKQDDLPLDVSVEDLEKSRKNIIEEKVWMTDETVSTGSWCYTENLKIKETKDVLHVLIDITSKNGVLLLNISPKADGSIPNNQKKVLLGIGSWLDDYGEAIYATKPWYTFGEGPTKEPEGHFKYHKEFLKIKYSVKDIRYTTNDNNIYAILLGCPEPGKEIILESFAADKIPAGIKVKNVSLLGYDENIKWKLQENGLVLSTPEEKLNEMAVVFKIKIK